MESLIIEKANSILPMSTVFELKHKEQVNRLKGIDRENIHYNIIYKCLTFMAEHGYPLSKYRIHNRKSILDLLIKNEFISECEHVIGHKNAGKYYVISLKGREYMKRYEKLGEMFL